MQLLPGVLWSWVPSSGEGSGAMAAPSLYGSSGGDAAMGCALPLSCLIPAPGLPLKDFKDKCFKKPQTKTQILTSPPPQKKQKSEKAKESLQQPKTHGNECFDLIAVVLLP